MADVLIVCVREDEPQAKALADMFEAAGFSIGGAPSNDGALRSSGAGVVVWSQASIRSRPFLDAAQRVINAGKAVVASLIEPPPASSIGGSPAFDLSSWDGDPNDPALDSLFFAVDRMVNSTRASVGAAPAQPAAFEPPPPTPRPTPRPPRATPGASATPMFRGPQGNDQLGAEAEHWRAIRDSNDPADFMDYLARYGADGSFAEVAEIRLKRLTGGGGRTPARPITLTPTSRPAPRAETSTPRRVDPPLQRRAEAPAPSQRRATSPPDRGFDRNDLREPPRGEGGALRAFILLGLLGAAVVAGVLYFGVRLPQSGPASDEIAAVDAPPAIGDSNAENGEGPDRLTLSEAAAAPRSVRPTERREPPPRRPPAQQREEAEAPPPAPVTSWTGDGSTGPVSLVPSEQGAAPTAIVPLPPLQIAPEVQVAAASPPPTVLATVQWTQRPSARRISELYPAGALRDGVGGRVILDCIVQPALSVICGVASESPAGAGFGRAALSASSAYRANAARSDGSSSVGARARLAVNFQPPPQ